VMRFPCRHRHAKVKHHGAALMIMIVILVMGIVAALIGALSLSTLQSARQGKTSAALAQAKEALIGYAVTYGDNYSGQVHGYLPCPDTSGSSEGSAAPPCGTTNQNAIGKLPWKVLGLPPLRDGDGECLWYAVSGTYKNNPKTGLMNWDTNGLLQAYASDGTLITPTDNKAVAIIIAPGAAQSGQNRSGTTAPVCGGNYTAANYLENNVTLSINNADVATGKFVQGVSGSSVNDQFIFITREDIWNAAQKRTDFQNTLKLLTQRVAECIANFGKHNNDLANKSLPWPAWVSFATTNSDYADNLNYNDKFGMYAGRVPYKVNTSSLTTGNSISTPYYLLQDDAPAGSANCPSGWATIYPWWDNWKDHLYYAIGKKFEPASTSTGSCGGGTCLTINGAGNYAAVVILAGKKLSGQTRANKSLAADYLEGLNNVNFVATPVVAPIATGAENYQTGPVSSTFNDILYCIKEDLTVIPCP